MGSLIKTPEELDALRRGGALLSQALAAAVAAVAPGISTAELDRIATEVIRQGGAEPSFLGYQPRGTPRPFPSTLCTSINHEVVHAPATPGRLLAEGDIIGLDIGLRLDGMCTDMAVSVPVGKVDRTRKRLMAVTRDSLTRAIAVVKPGSTVRDVGRAVQAYVEANGFGVVRDLVGHGIGRALHEDPRIPNYVDPQSPNMAFAQGMAICIEPMVTEGDWEVATADDGWTVVTADGKASAHFEVTLIVTDNGAEVITPLPV